ncbi:MAG: hypothetical protein LAT50_21975, partial [Ectothiorhodospiraceae bacterium]|nr:hypothetical protein [Ectothiorhodospiraceae bacterium]
MKFQVEKNPFPSCFQKLKDWGTFTDKEFEIRKTAGEVVEFLARGERQGVRVLVGLVSFELSLFNVLPGEPFG